MLIGGALIACANKPNWQKTSTPDDAFKHAGDRPPSARTLYELSEILAAQGKDQQCHYVLTRLIKQHPQFLPAYSKLAELHQRNDRSREAIEALKLGLEKQPDAPVLRNNLGMCYVLAGRHERALTQFTRAAEADPRRATYQANRAAMLALLGETDQSEKLYRRLVDRQAADHNLKLLASARQRLRQAQPPSPADPPPAATQPDDLPGTSPEPTPLSQTSPQAEAASPSG
jgi:Flp pilus assembly protein TadD